jgi:DNA-binding transcriptional ArsR family regulator
MNPARRPPPRADPCRIRVAPAEDRRLPSPARLRHTIASVVDQPTDLRTLRDVHRALADVNRLRIIRRLADGAASIGDLVETVGLSQPLVSWHISRLRAAGIVETQRSGRETRVAIRPGAFRELAARERELLGVEG